MSQLCLLADPDKVFPQLQLSQNRRENRTCRDCHPGLCKHEHKEVLQDAKRLAGEIHASVVALGLKPGELLIKIAPSVPRDGEVRFWWLMRRVNRPQRLFFCEAVQNSQDGQQFVDIKRPLARKSQFGIAVELMNRRCGNEQWTLQAVHHKTSCGPLWRTLQVGESEPHILSCVRRAKDKVEEDPLEKALKEACSTRGRKRRRIRQKGKLGAEDSSDEDVDPDEDPDADDESSSSSERAIVTVVRTDAAKGPATAASAAPKTAFFKQLGIKIVEAKHPGKAKCRLCSEKVAKNQIRGTWAYDKKKPPAYIHVTCAHRMEEPDARVALDLLQLLVVADGPDAVALREDASTALRLFGKRLPEAGSYYMTRHMF